MPTAGAVWVVPTPDAEPPPGGFSVTPVVRKPAGGRLYVEFDFGNDDGVWSGDMIASAVLSAAGPTVGDPVLAGQRGGLPAPYRVGAWYSGGSAGEYPVTCTATMASGAVLVGVGTLSIY